MLDSIQREIRSSIEMGVGDLQAAAAREKHLFNIGEERAIFGSWQVLGSSLNYK